MELFNWYEHKCCIISATEWSQVWLQFYRQISLCRTRTKQTQPNSPFERCNDFEFICNVHLVLPSTQWCRTCANETKSLWNSCRKKRRKNGRPYPSGAIISILLNATKATKIINDNGPVNLLLRKAKLNSIDTRPIFFPFICTNNITPFKYKLVIIPD